MTVITRKAIKGKVGDSLHPEVDALTEAQLSKYQGLIDNYQAGARAEAGWYATIDYALTTLGVGESLSHQMAHAWDQWE